MTLPVKRVVDVNIDKATQFPTRRGFGTLLIVTSEKPATDATVVTFGDISEVAEYWGADSEVYGKLNAAFSQNPKPLLVKAAYVDLSSAPASGEGRASAVVSALDTIEGIDDDWYGFCVCPNVLESADEAFHPRQLFVGSEILRTGGYYSTASGGVKYLDQVVTGRSDIANGVDVKVNEMVNLASPEALGSNAFLPGSIGDSSALVTGGYPANRILGSSPCVPYTNKWGYNLIPEFNTVATGYELLAPDAQGRLQLYTDTTNGYTHPLEDGEAIRVYIPNIVPITVNTLSVFLVDSADIRNTSLETPFGLTDTIINLQGVYRGSPAEDSIFYYVNTQGGTAELEGQSNTNAPINGQSDRIDWLYSEFNYDTYFEISRQGQQITVKSPSAFNIPDATFTTTNTTPHVMFYTGQGFETPSPITGLTDDNSIKVSVLNTEGNLYCQVGQNSVDTVIGEATIPPDEKVLLGIYSMDYNAAVGDLSELLNVQEYTFITRMTFIQDLPQYDLTAGEIRTHSLSVNKATGTSITRVDGVDVTETLIQGILGDPATAGEFFGRLISGDEDNNADTGIFFMGYCIPATHLFMIPRALTLDEVIQVETYINENK